MPMEQKVTSRARDLVTGGTVQCAWGRATEEAGTRSGAWKNETKSVNLNKHSYSSQDLESYTYQQVNEEVYT